MDCAGLYSLSEIHNSADFAFTKQLLFMFCARTNETELWIQN